MKADTLRLRKIDIVKGEHRSPEFLAINPAGLVPILVTPRARRCMRRPP